MQMQRNNTDMHTSTYICREYIHHIVYSSYSYRLVLSLSCQHTNALLGGPLPWKKSGRETWQRVSRSTEGGKRVKAAQTIHFRYAELMVKINLPNDGEKSFTFLISHSGSEENL